MPDREIKIEDIIVEITEYENLAKVKLEEARFQAEESVKEAEKKGQELLRKRNAEASEEAKKIINKAKERALLSSKKIVEEEKRKVEMYKAALPQIQREVAREIINTLFTKKSTNGTR